MFAKKKVCAVLSALGCLFGHSQYAAAESFSTDFAFGTSGQSVSVYSIDALTYGLDPTRYRLDDVSVSGTHSFRGEYTLNQSANSVLRFSSGATGDISNLFAGNFTGLPGRPISRSSFRDIDFSLSYGDTPVGNFDLTLDSFASHPFVNNFSADFFGTIDTEWSVFLPDQQHLVLDFVTSTTEPVETSIKRPALTEYSAIRFINALAFGVDSLSKEQQDDIVGDVQRTFSDVGVNVKVFHSDDAGESDESISSTVKIVNSLSECETCLSPEFGPLHLGIKLGGTDFGNDNKQDEAYVFAKNAVLTKGFDGIVKTISHEAGHLFGLDHLPGTTIMQADPLIPNSNNFSDRAAACLQRNVNGIDISCDAGGSSEIEIAFLDAIINGRETKFALPNTSSGSSIGYTLLDPELLGDGSFGFLIPEFEGFGAFLGRTYELYEGDPEEFDAVLDWQGLFNPYFPDSENTLFDVGFGISFEELVAGSMGEKTWVAANEGGGLRNFSTSTFSILGDQPPPSGGGSVSTVPIPMSIIALMSGILMLFSLQLLNGRIPPKQLA